MVDTVNICFPSCHSKMPDNGGLSSMWRGCRRNDVTFIPRTDGSLFISASLRRLLHRNNHTLINKQSEMDQSFTELRARVAPLVEVDWEQCVFTRVDLVWHFNREIEDFTRALYGCKHPKIRANHIHYYDGHGLFWIGSKCKIRMYDPMFKAKKIYGNITRLEIELHSNALRKAVNRNFQPVHTLDFSQAYRAYRNLVCEFQPKPVTRISGVDELATYLDARGIRIGHRTALDCISDDYSKRQQMRIKKRVKAAHFETVDIDFRKLLPENPQQLILP